MSVEPEDRPGEDAGEFVAALIRGKNGGVGSHADTSSNWSKPTATFAWRPAGCLAESLYLLTTRWEAELTRKREKNCPI
jgi:hypothetical protein